MEEREGTSDMGGVGPSITSQQISTLGLHHVPSLEPQQTEDASNTNVFLREKKKRKIFNKLETIYFLDIQCEPSCHKAPTQP